MSCHGVQSLVDILRARSTVLVGSGMNASSASFEEKDVVVGLNYSLNDFHSSAPKVLFALDHRVDVSKIVGEFDCLVLSPILFSQRRELGCSTDRITVLRNLGYSGFASDLSLGVYYGHTVAYAALQCLLFAQVISVKIQGVSISYWNLNWAAVRARLDTWNTGRNLTDLSLCATQAAQVSYAVGRLEAAGIKVNF